MHNVCHILDVSFVNNNQGKLGSNTSVLRTNRIVRLDLDEGWCATLHYIAIHHKRIDLDEGWCETLHYITIHHKRIDLHECCMGLVLGRKPEHETLYFSV